MLILWKSELGVSKTRHIINGLFIPFYHLAVVLSQVRVNGSCKKNQSTNHMGCQMIRVFYLDTYSFQAQQAQASQITAYLMEGATYVQGSGRASGGLCEEDSHWASLTWLLNDDICRGYMGPVSATPVHSLQCLCDFFSFKSREKSRV